MRLLSERVLSWEDVDDDDSLLDADELEPRRFLVFFPLPFFFFFFFFFRSESSELCEDDREDDPESFDFFCFFFFFFFLSSSDSCPTNF